MSKTTARNQPEQLGRDFRGNAAKAVVALGGILRRSDALTADLIYWREHETNFGIILTTRYNPVECNAVIACVLGHHFLGHSPVLIAGGDHRISCSPAREAEGFDWAGRFLRAADSQQSEAWRQRVMRARQAGGEPS